jgi:hypothetical protein
LKRHGSDGAPHDEGTCPDKIYPRAQSARVMGLVWDHMTTGPEEPTGQVATLCCVQAVHIWYETFLKLARRPRIVNSCTNLR